MSLRSTQVVPRINSSLFFIAMCIPWCGLFFHSPTEGHLSSFQLQVMTSKAAVNIWVLCDSMSSFPLDIYLGADFWAMLLITTYLSKQVCAHSYMKAKWFLITLLLFCFFNSYFQYVFIFTICVSTKNSCFKHIVSSPFPEMTLANSCRTRTTCSMPALNRALSSG